MNDTRRAIILDGDPGHDDAIAWVLAQAATTLDIKAITTVGGNQNLAKVTLNAQKIARLIAYHGPIAAGAAQPLLNELVVAPDFHGESGLDGVDLPEPTTTLSPLSAPELMAEIIRTTQTPLTIVATGPLTNVATLLILYPELKNKIERIAIMGGGIRNGNWTASAEFNFFEDPEAAALVFRSGIPLTLAPLDVTEQALIYPKDIATIEQIDNQVAKVVAAWLRFFTLHHQELGWSGAPLHDPCALLSLVAPELFTVKQAYIEVECSGDYTKGTCVAKWRHLLNGDLAPASNSKSSLDGTQLSLVDVLLGIDRDAFVQKICTLLKSYQ